MITDFFSHKIHSSGPEWPEKLVELAAIFAEFDEEVFDRPAFEQRLLSISKRASYVGGNRSAFRDEYSAYPAYFGLYHLQPSTAGWRVTIGATTKEFLLIEEPDTAAFLRAQLTLFQYPNGMGAVYKKGTNSLRLQANTRDRMLEYIREGIHLSPLRLICAALISDAALRGVELDSACVTAAEVYAIANQKSVNFQAAPPEDEVRKQLSRARRGLIEPPSHFETRFHLLKHLDLFAINGGMISVRETSGLEDRERLLDQVRTIAGVKNEFGSFDGVKDGQELSDLVRSGAWGEYFDALLQLDAATVNILAGEVQYEQLGDAVRERAKDILEGVRNVGDIAVIYPLKPRSENMVAGGSYQGSGSKADPEVTRIRRQRSNLTHKQLVSYVDQLVRGKGAEPQESQHIDLCAQIPGDGTFIFEMKSGGQKLIDQIRKGVSQLYEYRYRYRQQLHGDVTLCLVLPRIPIPAWIFEYLCVDRQICVCWFDDDGNIGYADQCQTLLSPLVTALSD